MFIPGIICVWQGAINDLPAGWVPCDGNNDTPDLRNHPIPDNPGTIVARKPLTFIMYIGE